MERASALWERVKGKLPDAVRREVEESRHIETMRDAIDLVSAVTEQPAWPLWCGVLYEQVMAQQHAAHAVAHLLRLDHRLGVWCASELAKLTLPHLNEASPYPAAAIEIAQRWVSGAATHEDCVYAYTVLNGLHEAKSRELFSTRDVGYTDSQIRIAALYAIRAVTAQSRTAAGRRTDHYRAQAVRISVQNTTFVCADISDNGMSRRLGTWVEWTEIFNRDLCRDVAKAVITMPWETIHEGQETGSGKAAEGQEGSRGPDSSPAP